MTENLTLQQLKDMKPGIFASGIILNPMLHSEPVKWVAVRGGIHDWALYYHTIEHNNEWVRDHGDKCFTTSIIRSLVPCEDEAFEMYRF